MCRLLCRLNGERGFESFKLRKTAGARAAAVRSRDDAGVGGWASEGLRGVDETGQGRNQGSGGARGPPGPSHNAGELQLWAVADRDAGNRDAPGLRQWHPGKGDGAYDLHAIVALGARGTRNVRASSLAQPTRVGEAGLADAGPAGDAACPRLRCRCCRFSVGPLQLQNGA